MTNLELNSHDLKSDNVDASIPDTSQQVYQPQQLPQQCTEVFELSSEGLKIGSSIITPCGMEALIYRLLENKNVLAILKVKEDAEAKTNGYVN